MPNWCHNVVTLSHPTDTKLINRIGEAIENKRLFEEFHPMPDPLKDTDSPPPLKTQDDRAVSACLKAEYGADNWYDWRVENWGTKWDVVEIALLNKSPTEVKVEFQTAWYPPIAFYSHIKETTDANVTAYYWEPGCDYLGRYANGVTQDYKASTYLDHLDATGSDPIDITTAMDFESHFLDRDEWEKEELTRQDMWLESEIAFGEDNEEEF
jgi:hypothetical protein